MQPPLGDTAELGWALTPSKQGIGYATEAVNATLQWAREHFSASDVACLIDPHHWASIRVATKCGFVQRRIVTYKGVQVIVFGRSL
jgi:RimJ/RimL family protein N-acetyltransferase